MINMAIGIGLLNNMINELFTCRGGQDAFHENGGVESSPPLPSLYSLPFSNHVLSTLSSDVNKVLGTLRNVRPKGSVKFISGIRIAQVCVHGIGVQSVWSADKFCGVQIICVLCHSLHIVVRSCLSKMISHGLLIHSTI